MANQIRLLILGTGGMANTHAAEFAKIASVSLVAAVDLDAKFLAEFQENHQIENGFASLEAALLWGAFDAVANVTPDAVHYATTMQVLAAGKHILCEKPLATNAQDAEAMVLAAAEAGVVNMVNLSYRNVPALHQGAAMVRAGAIGAIRHFEASYLQSWLVQPAWGAWDQESQWLWRLSSAHGSKGVLGDVGIHILDFATYAANQAVAEVSCRLATFHKAPGDQIGAYKLDANDSAVLQITLENGALGTISATRFAAGHLNDLHLRIYGDKGGIEVCWHKNVSTLRACLSPDLESAEWQDVETPDVATIYEKFVLALQGKGRAEPDFSRGAALQTILDRAEESAARKSLSLAI